MPTRTVTVIRPQENLTLKYRWPAVLAVRAAIRGGLFKQAVGQEVKLELLKTLGAKVLEAYSVGIATPIPPFTLEIVPDARARGFGGGCYSMERRHIMLDKPSLTSFLHELAHHIQYCRDGSTTENYAQRWSLGLFKRATPNLFATAVAEGRLYFVEPSVRHEQASFDPDPSMGTPLAPTFYENGVNEG